MLQNIKGDLAIIASDITTETKAVFPKHAVLYYENPGEVSPSEFVRMSMSIPVFFQPKEVGGYQCPKSISEPPSEVLFARFAGVVQAGSLDLRLIELIFYVILAHVLDHPLLVFRLECPRV